MLKEVEIYVEDGDRSQFCGKTPTETKGKNEWFTIKCDNFGKKVVGSKIRIANNMDEECLHF